MGRFIRSVLAVIVAAILAWGVFFGRGNVMRAVGGVRSTIGGFFTASSSAATVQALSIENAGLRAALVAASASSTLVGRYHYRVGQVYSRYPYNDKGMLVVNVGSAEGIRPGMPVMAGEGVLLGRVASVERTESEVQTIFSPDWKSTVEVGTSSVKAVLEGGITPTLSLIPKEAMIADGAAVTNLSPEYPFGASLGSAVGVEAVPNDVWQKADVATPFKLETVTNVLIVLDFP